MGQKGRTHLSLVPFLPDTSKFIRTCFYNSERIKELVSFSQPFKELVSFSSANHRLCFIYLMGYIIVCWFGAVFCKARMISVILGYNETYCLRSGLPICMGKSMISRSSCLQKNCENYIHQKLQI